MGAKAYQTSGLYSLNARAIQEYLNDFLCSDSVDSYSNSILTRADSQPDSFTVLERLSSPNFLSPWERDARESLKSQVAAEIQMLQAESGVFYDKAELISALTLGFSPAIGYHYSNQIGCVTRSLKKRCRTHPAGGLGVYPRLKIPPRLGERGLNKTFSALSPGKVLAARRKM